MKKVVALVMTFIVVGLAFDVSSFETRADGMSAGFAETNYLLWTYLDTMFMATAGEQASDTTINHTNKNYNLYRDFISFCNETSENASTVAKIEVATAKYGYIKMKNAIDAFETDGSSALNTKVTDNFKIISGGGNPSNNDDDDNNDDDLTYLGSASSTALTTLIGQYLTDLYNGKRGDVSKEVLQESEKRNYYFDGNYVVDNNNLYFTGCGKTKLTDVYYNSYSCVYYDKTNHEGAFSVRVNDVIADDRNTDKSRFALLATYEPSINYKTNTFAIKGLYEQGSDSSTSNSMVGLLLYYRAKNKLGNYEDFYYDTRSSKIFMSYQNSDLNNALDYEYFRLQSKCINNDGSEMSGYFAIGQMDVKNISGIPVFDTQEKLKNYLNTGDASDALNYYVPKENPLNWYNFQLSNITNQLSKITQMLTQLPQITTDMLHGFAVGVTGATAGVGANTNPNAQEESVKKAMEESANNTAKKYYQKTSKKSKEKLEKEMKVTPSPTKTPTKKVEQTDATMMVDLHEFFPFCVPYDLVHLIKCFCAEPQTPKFNVNIKLPYIGKIDTCLDLSMFDDGARILRILETIGFILALVLVSRNLIRG